MSANVAMWEGVPLTELSRETLIEAVVILMEDREYWVGEVMDSHRQRINRLLQGGKR